MQPPLVHAIVPTLRVATGEAHQRLEQTVDITRCAADLDRYRQLLARFLGFYRPLERRLGALPGWETSGVDFSNRLKTPWLAADLRALGLSAAVESLPRCVDLPCTDDLSHGFGCLYVLEGATLGGRQITALLRDSPVPPDARAFFGSYGAETGTRWKEFVAALETHAATASEKGRAAVVKGGVETFDRLQRWIEDGGAHS